MKKINSIEFNEATHTYAINGEIATMSVTELLAKHKLAPDYSGVNKVLLQDSAELGTAIHKDLEDISNGSKPTTPQGESFAKWLKSQNVDQQYAEVKMGLVWDKLIIGGTADLICCKDNEVWIADHKTTSTVHKKAVTWQVNLLDYMAQFNLPNYERATKFLCLHYDKFSEKMEVVELEKIPDSEIEKLLNNELCGVSYTQPTLDIVEEKLKQEIENAEMFLLKIEKEYKEAKANAENLRSKLCELFEKTNTTAWVSPNGIIKANYITPTTRTSIDSDKLKTNYPEIYEKCLKRSTTKGYIKIATNKI